MAENEISEYFEVDVDNVDIAGVTVQENVMKPSNVNNAFRGLQGALKRWFKTSLFRLRDSTDQTKLLAFNLSGITTATTRTLTVPDANGTLIVDQGSFRLKQSASPSPTAEGDIQWDTDDNAIVVGDGASARIFRANPWEVVASATSNNIPALDLTNLGAFRQLRFAAKVFVAIDGVNLQVRTSTDNGSSFAASSGDYVTQASNAAGSVFSATTVIGATGVGHYVTYLNGVGNAANEALSFTLDIFDFNRSAYCFFQSNAFYIDQSGNVNIVSNGGVRSSAAARNALRIVASSGNIASIEYTLEGIRS